MISIIIALILSFFFLISVTFAQSWSGKIIDEGGSPLSNANILLANTALSTLSDDEGNFILEKPNAALIYALNISITGGTASIDAPSNFEAGEDLVIKITRFFKTSQVMQS